MASPFEDNFYGNNPHSDAFGQHDDREGIVGGARPKSRGTARPRGRGFYHHSSNVNSTGADIKRDHRADRGRGMAQHQSFGRGRPISAAGHRGDDRKSTRNNDERGDKSSDQPRGGYRGRGAPFYSRPRQSEGQSSSTQRSSDARNFGGAANNFRFKQPTNRYLLPETKEGKASAFVSANESTSSARQQGRGDQDPLTSPTKPQAKLKTTAPPIPDEILQSLLEEDPSDILKTFVSRKDEFLALLEQKQFTDDAFMLTLQLLSFICDLDSVAAVRKDLNIVLSMVDSSSFLSKHMSRYLVGLTTKQSQSKDLGNSNETFASEVNLVLKLVSVFLQHKPSGCGEVGAVLILLDKVVTSVAFDDDEFDPQGALMKQVQHLTDIFTHLEKAQQSAREKARERQPPNNFREIPIFPDGSEIRKPTRPFLRKNIIKGKYDNVEHYLDVQFRLLREDFVAPLREGVTEYLSDTKNRLQDIRIYRNARIVDKGKLTNNGFVYTLHFDEGGLEHVRWESSKRLIYGSFVCLTKDNFQHILCATIENRTIEGLQRGIVEIRFLTEIGDTAPRGPFIMAESAAYFEACRHVLQGLQQMTPRTFPFKKFIVEVSSDVDQPAYLGGNAHITYDLSSLVPSHRSSVDSLLGLTEHTAQYIREHTAQYIREHTARYLRARTSHISLNAASVPILRPMRWPSAENLHLDESQKAALQAALTKEFAIIQGPPGTGKTYIGLKIIQILLHNKPWTKSSTRSDKLSSTYEKVDHTGSPILVVCFTNHALDQFLEGIVAFGEENVIRVGGRSGSEVLKSKNLSQIRRDRLRRSRQQNVCVGDLKRKLREAEVNVENTLSKTDLAKTVILNFAELKSYLSMENSRDLIMPWIRGRNRSAPTTNLLGWLHVVDSTIDVPTQPYENFQWGQTQGRESRIDVEDEGYRIQQERRIDSYWGDRDQPSQTEEDEPVDKISAYNSTCIKRCGKNQCSTPKAELRKQDCMTEEEANEVRSIWHLRIWDRWRLYRLWTKRYVEAHEEKLDKYRKKYEKLSKQMQIVNNKDDVLVLKEASVVGMTTTGAAKFRSVLQLLGPRIVIVEEAAEVLEAHIITALTAKCQHLILIGDHQQLRPNPTVYRLAKVFNMDTSLFERMVNNGVPCQTLTHQHRMRPEISKLMKKHFYENLQDDESVMGFDDIKGVTHNMFFIDHNEFEDGSADDNKTKSNQHEAEVLVELCRYLIHQGYKPTQITILTTYVGQLFTFKKLMDKETFERVRVSVVDNYQGEENDIILLSLVRSNEEGSIGFLKTSNRVCVALSRARMGFYCIGNASILKKAQIWQDIIGTLEAGNRIGSTLRLVCQNHPDRVAEVASAEDFRAKVPQGGCGGPCEYRLPCGHVCVLLCHPYDRDHEVHECRKPCLTFCDRAKHPCPKRCYVECGDCTIKVTKQMPDCGHNIDVYCYVFDSASCTIPCTETLECGHLCGEYCSQPCTSDCIIEVIKTLPCDHSLSLKCCEDPTEAECPTHVMKVLPCGHELVMKCCQEPKHDDCTKQCEKTLACGHKCQQKCREICKIKLSLYSLLFKIYSGSLESFSSFCLEKCEVILPCGHPCPNKCGEPCSTPEIDELYSCLYTERRKLPETRIATKCAERVQRRLPGCGHSADMLCYEDVAEVRCQAACTKQLACNHPCINRCYQPCSRCNKKAQRTLPCGHIAQVPCSLNANHFKCNKKCNNELACGHQCPNQCCDPCPRPGSYYQFVRRGKTQTNISARCEATVQKSLPNCHHTVTTPCYKDITSMRCNKKCNNELACGHQCPNQCCDPCPRPGSYHQFVRRGKTKTNISARCEATVQKSLPNCHHTVTTPCYKDTTSMRCSETCNKVLACNHRCTNKCGAPCRCKLKVWKRFLTCKHSLNLPCHRDITPNDICKKCQNNGCLSKNKSAGGSPEFHGKR